MTVKEHIKGSLAELERAGKINPYIHALLLTRLDTLVATIGDYDSVEEAVKGELCSFDMEPGYQNYGNIMVALTREEALAAFDEGGAPIFAVCADGTEFELESREVIELGYHSYAIEKGHTLTFRPEMELSL